MSGEYLKIEELEDFFKQDGDELYTYLSILSRDPELAGDLLQSVYLKFIEKVKEGVIIKETAAHYARTMARNEFYEHCRRRKRETPLTETDTLVTDERRAEIETASRRIDEILMESITGPDIPTDIAEVLRLRLLRGESMEAICNKTKRSQATVYRMMEKGMRCLARIFEKEGLGLEDLRY